VAVDEAHSVRNLTKPYWASFLLRSKSKVTIAITATPATTRASDLFNIGRCFGIPGFDASADGEAVQMERELRSAKRRDLKARPEAGHNTIRGIIHGDESVDVDSEHRKAMLQWIGKIRERFASAVIRRTVHSTDNKGNPISGLEPYLEHNLVLNLYKVEMDNLNRIAEVMVTDEAAVARGAARFGAGGVCFK
jgi:hypothetical protein